MATIRNIIQTVFQSRGADSTAKDVERVNRNMTRLGQSSASAGRSFAAQSQGLGGLVAAYAGAAATTFALQQAFDALSRSARQSQTFEGLGALAAASGESSTMLLNNVREITKNQITLAEAASQINLSLSAGFDSSQIEGLAEVALKASRALGRDLNDAYTRVVRGSAKLETELLDELGIYTKIEPSTRAYAASVGKVASELTEFERRQAFANGVIEEGTRKFGMINTTIPTTAEKIEAFGIRILDIAGSLGRFLADTIAPLAEFLTNNLAASFGSVGLAASLVASKGIQVLQGAIDDFGNAVEARAASINQRILSIGASAKKAQEEARKSLANISIGSGLVGDSRKEITALKAIAQQRTLSTQELKAGTKALQDRINQIENRLIPNNQKVLAQAQQELAALKKGSSAYDEKAKAVLTATNALERNRQILQSTTAELNNLTLATNIAQARLAAFAGSSIKFLGSVSVAAARAATGMVGLAASTISIASIAGIVGTALASLTGKQAEYNATIQNSINLLKSFFVPKSVIETTDAYLSLTSRAVENLQSVNNELRDLESFKFESVFAFGFTVDIEKTKKDLVQEVSAALTEAGKEGGKTFIQSLISGLAGAGALIGGTIGSIIGTALAPLTGGISIAIGGKLGMAIGGAIGAGIDRSLSNKIKEISSTRLSELEQLANLNAGALSNNEELRQAAAILDEQYGTAAELSLEGRNYLATQLQLLATMGSTTSSIKEIVLLSKELSVSADQVLKRFKVLEDTEYSVTVAPDLEFVKDVKGQVRLTVINEQEILSIINNITNQVKNISAEGISVTLNSNKGKELQTEIDSLNNKTEQAFSNINREVETSVNSIERFEEQIESTRRTIESLNSEIGSYEILPPSSYDIGRRIAGEVARDASRSIEEREKAAELVIVYSRVLHMLYQVGNARKELTRLQEEANEASIRNGNVIQRMIDQYVRFNSQLTNAQQELDNYIKTVVGFGTNVSIVSNGILDLTTSNQSITNSLARFSSALIDLNNLVRSGSADLEMLGQQEGVLLKQFESLSKGASVSSQKISELQNALSSLQQGNAEEIAAAYGIEASRVEEIRNELNSLLNTQVAISEANIQSLQNALQAYDVYMQQLEPLKETLRLQKQLNDTFGQNVFAPTREFGLPEDQFGFRDDQERFIAQQTALNNIVEETQEQLLREAKLREAILGMEELSSAQKQAILTVTRENVDSVVDNLGLETELAETLKTRLGVQGDITVATAQEKAEIEAATVAANVLLNTVSERLNKALNIAEAWTQQLDSIKRETQQFLAEDKVTKLQLELDLTNLNFDIAGQRIQNEISKIQGNIRIVQAEEDAGLTSSLDAAKTIADSNSKLIQLQTDLENNRYSRELANIDAREEILIKESEIAVEKIMAEQELLVAKVNADAAYVQSLVDTMNADNKAKDDLNKSANDAMAEIFNSFLAALASVIPDAEAPGSIASTYASTLKEIENTYKEQAVKVIDAIDNSTSIRATAIAENTALSLEALDQERVLAQLQHDERMNQMASENAARGIADQAAIDAAKKAKDAGGKGKKAGEEAEKAFEDALKTIEEFQNKVEQGFRELINLANRFLDAIFSNLIKNKEKEVELATSGETVTTDILSTTTEYLNSVQSELSDALSKEASLKEEVLSITDALNNSHINYLTAIKEGDFIKASDDYVSALLEQSRKTIDLNSAIKDRTILEGAVQSLEEQKASSQKYVEQATKNRIDAESDLAELQNVSAAILEIVSERILDFNSGLENLDYVLQAVSGNLGTAVGGIQDPLNTFTAEINKVGKAIGTFNNLSTQFGSGAVSAAKEAVSSSDAVLQAKDLGTTAGNSIFGGVVKGISGALSGAGIGSSIGKLLGDDTWASTIGGAVGGAVGTIFAGTKFLSGITSTIASATGLAAGAAGAIVTGGLSLIGSLLVGTLFGGPKKAQARIQGVVGEEGFELNKVSRENISKTTANSVGDFVEQVYSSIFTTLDKLGLEFKDNIDVFVRNSDGEFGRITSTFESGFIGTAADLGESSKKAGEELVSQFFKGLTVERNVDGIVTFRSLVVNALTPNRDDLQQAIDTFAELDNINEKTQERFIEAVKFANQFSERVSSLNSSAPSLADSLELIGEAAQSTASNLLLAYSEFESQTVKFFGETSSQTTKAREAIRKNALAFIGLAEASDGSLISLEKYAIGMNAGRIAIEKTIKDIQAFENVLPSIGFTLEETANTIGQALDVNVTKQVNEFATNISDALAVLKDPSQEAVLGLVSIVDNSDALILNAQGTLQGLIDNEQSLIGVREDLITAEKALADSEELRGVRIENYLKTLNTAELKAIIASNERFDAETRSLALQQLAIEQERERSEAIKRFISAVKDFNKRIEQITGSVSNPLFASNFTSLGDVAELLGSTDITPFVTNLTDSVNSITAFSNINNKLNSSLELLHSSLADNTITTSEFIDSLVLVSDATLTAIETQKELVDAYEDAFAEIIGIFNSAQSELTGSIGALRNELVGLVDSIQESTSTIFNIYDDTIVDIAQSGNELFDLRDSAREAFEASAKAVSEFEKANSISGKSAAGIRTEIETIQNNIDRLLSGGSLSLETFRQLSMLSSEQNALKRELTNVIAVEDEYKSLLVARTSAAEDLAFAESSIITLGDNLVDTRRTESQVIQQVQDTVVQFTKAQEDLQAITEILAENNFDLNQIRTDEIGRVKQVSEAIKQLNQDTSQLTESINGILNDPSIRINALEAAEKLGAIIAGGLELDEDSIEWNTIITEKLNEAADIFDNGLTPIAQALKNFLEGTAVDIAATNSQVESSGFQISLISTRFRNFNEDLIKYLDVEGLSQFYGSGGVFEKFRNSLYSTLVTDGFEVLTSSGGPLDGFAITLSNVANGLNNLIDIGAILSSSVSGVTDAEAGTSLIQILGDAPGGLTSVFNGLVVVGSYASDSLYTLTNEAGTLVSVLDEYNNLTVTFDAVKDVENIITSISAFATDLSKISVGIAASGISANIITAVNLIDSSILDAVDITINATNKAGDIVSQINSFNNAIQNLTITNNVSALSGNIAFQVNTFGNILDSLVVSNNASALGNDIRTQVNTFNSLIGRLIVSPKLSSVTKDILVQVQTFESTLGLLEINSNIAKLSSSIVTQVTTYESNISALKISTNTEAISRKIRTQVNTYNSAVSSLSVSTNAIKISTSIVTQISSFNSEIDKIIVTSAVSNIAGSIRTQIDNYNSTINILKVSTNAKAITGNILTQVNTFNKSINELTVTTNATAISSTIATQINTYNARVGILTVVNTAETVSSNIATQVNTFNSNISILTVDNSASIISSNIATQINTFNSRIGKLTVTNNANDTGWRISNQVNLYNSRVGELIVTNNANLISGNIVTQINAYNKSIGQLTVTNNAKIISGNIVTQITSFNTSVGILTVNNNPEKIGGSIATHIGLYNANVGKLVVNTNPTKVSKDIITQVNSFNNAVTSLSINTNPIDLSGSIRTQINTFNSNIGKVSVSTAATRLSGNIVNQISTFNSTIGKISVSTAATRLSGNIVNQVSAFNSTIGDISVNTTAAHLSNSIAGQVKLFNDQVSTDKLVVSADPHVQGWRIKNRVDVFNSYVSGLSVSNNTSTVSSNIVNQVNVFNSNIGKVSVSTAATRLSGNIVNQISTFNSTIGKISVSTAATRLSGNIVNQVSAFNSTIGDISVNTTAAHLSNSIAGQVKLFNDQVSTDKLVVSADPHVQGWKIKNRVDVFNSYVSGLSVSNNTSTVSSTIVNQVNAFNSNIGKVSVSTAAANLSGNIVNQVNAFNSNIGKVSVNTTADTLSGSIVNQVNAFNSNIDKVSVNTTAANLSGSIVNQVNAFNSNIDKVSVNTTAANLSGSIVNQISTFNSNIGKISVSTAATRLSGNIVNQVSAFNSTIGDISVNTTAAHLSNSIAGQVKLFNDQVSTDKLVVSADPHVQGWRIKNRVDVFNNYVSGLIVSSIPNDIGRGINYETNEFNNAVKGLVVSLTPTDIGRGIKYETNEFNNAVKDLNVETRAATTGWHIKSQTDIFNDYVKNLKVSATPNTAGWQINNRVSTFNKEVGNLAVDSSLSDISTDLTTIFDRLTKLFSTDDISNVKAFSNNLSTFNNVVKTLAENDINPKTPNVIETRLTNLIKNFQDLQRAIDKISAENAITNINDFWSSVIKTLNDEWSKVDTSISKIPDRIQLATKDWSTSDSANLKAVAINSSKYPQISGVQYAPGFGTFAEGGYVSGPGTSTSDSIPAKLSDGEYVLKASTVKSLGIGLLESINKTGDLAGSLARYGRLGDNLIAHINTEEMLHLLNIGGKGSINPQTGLLEFFGGKAPQAIGKMFAEQETNKLYDIYKSYMTPNTNKLLEPKWRSLTQSGEYSLQEQIRSFYNGGTQQLQKRIKINHPRYARSNNLADWGADPNTLNLWNQNTAQMASTQTFRDLGLQLASVQDLTKKSLSARGIGAGLNYLMNSYGVGGNKNKNSLSIGTNAPIDLKSSNYKSTQIRANQNIGDIASLKTGSYPSVNADSTFSKEYVRSFVDLLNKDYGNFTDFYMLKDISRSIPKFMPNFLNAGDMYYKYITKPALDAQAASQVSAATNFNSIGDLYTSGGIVRGQRDSIPAMLEPGEFVLRKAAVQKMGLDAAVQLNATGNTDTDTKVEVNVINNGTAQQPVSEPQIRRENGKIVIDVILEDIRNNGPIKRTIRSIR